MTECRESRYVLVEVSGRREVNDFLRVPCTIYRDDSNFIPHLVQDVEKVFDRSKNKAFEHGDLVRWILRDPSGRCVGRVASFIDERTANKYWQPTGSMGFFECIDDRDAAFVLFDACREWLEKRGMQAMDGPINFGDRIAFWGLLVENFTDPPTYQLSYNPPYYRNLFEAYGFQVYYYQYVYRRALRGPAPEVFVKKSEALRADPRFTMRTIRHMKDEQIARDFMAVFNDAWSHRDGFRPLTFDQAIRVIAALRPVRDPDITLFCYYDGRPIAFYVNIPELNQIFRHVDGNLDWLGKLKFLWHKHRHTANVMTGLVFGVVPEFQGRGVEGAMIRWCEEEVVPMNRYTDTIMTWIGDFNPRMLKVCENLSATRYRTLATFRYLFDRTVPFERAPME